MSNPNNTYDVILVGSGPAGVSAAWPLVEAQKNVLMLDVGNKPSKYIPPDSNEENHQTPKLSAPNLAFVFKDFKEQYRIQSERFQANGSLAMGGLSNAWSALSPAFSEEEFEKFPFPRSELLPFYQKTARRIGISGSLSGDLSEWLGARHLNVQPNLKLHPLSQFLLDRYERAKAEIHPLGFRMGRHCQAILTQPLGERRAFQQNEATHFTYTSDAVYNAAFEIPQLRRHKNFSLREGLFVEEVEKKEGVFLVSAKDRNDVRQTFSARRVVLAAGTIGSTKILLKALKKYETPLCLLTTVLCPFGLLVPKWIGKGEGFFGFSFWNLSYSLFKAYGHIMPTDGVPKTEFMKRLPFTSPSGLVLANYFWPAMILGTCLFPSDFSHNTISLKGPHDGEALAFQGAYDAGLLGEAKRAKKILRTVFRKMGAILLSWQITPPGSDLHYAGTLPMTKDPKPLHTSRDGESYDLAGLYIADGSVLPYLPAKSHTLTIMANAHRIGEKLATSF